MTNEFQPVFETGKVLCKAGFDALSNLKSIFVGNPEKGSDVYPSYTGKKLDEILNQFA